jgi:PAS domain S-box-containing protein
VLAVPLNSAKSKDAQIVFQSKLLEAVDESIIATDAQGQIIFWNEADSRTYGWDAIEVLGRSISEVIVPKIAQEDSAKIMETLGQGKRWSGEFQVQRRDGKVFPALVTDSPVFDEKGELSGIIGISIDLSTTKNLEGELVDLAKFPAENPNAVFRVNGNGVIVYANPVAQRLPLSFNLEAGHLVPEEWRKLVAQALSSESKMDFEEEAKGRLFSFSFSPIASEGYVNIYGLDITESKKTLKDLVMNTEKLRVVGSLTRHDVGNKLMVAKSNLYLLKKRIGDNPDLVKYLDNIDFALASSDEIFKFSHFYERIGAEKPSRENVFECFNQAAALKPNLGAINIVNECHGLVVVADVLLKQLFYNFIDNSVKHGEKVTQIRLHYSEDGDEVKLFYEDNGVGVPDSNKLKLFEAGFSTGKGSGLGLYLVKKMMDVYGWTIIEEGEQGKGAKFTMTIPKLNKNGKENCQNLNGVFKSGQ